VTGGGPYAGAALVAVLPVADLDRAELWYGRLGFEVTAGYPDYRVLRAGHLHLHLRELGGDEGGPSTAGVYLTLPTEDAVTTLYAAWLAAGPGVLAPPELRPHGMVEFAAEDPDGNLWRIGAPESRADAAGAPDTASDTASDASPHVAPGAGHADGDGDAASGAPALPPEPAAELQVPTGAPGRDEGAPVEEPDWLVVVASGRCAVCELTAGDGPSAGLAGRLRDEAHRWAGVLRDADDDAVRRRPSPDVWSALEYGVHVRDVLAVFTERVLRTLAEVEPELGWWDHEAAIADGFANESDRTAVGDDLVENAGRLAEVLTRVAGDQWERGATRRESERFTVELLVRFALHEVVHHRDDAERSLGDG
jgi:predicted lactoylglutathione lyase